MSKSSKQHHITKKPHNIVSNKNYSFSLPPQTPLTNYQIKFSNTIFEQEIHYKFIDKIMFVSCGCPIVSITGEQLYQNYLITGSHFIPFPSIACMELRIVIEFNLCNSHELYMFYYEYYQKNIPKIKQYKDLLNPHLIPDLANIVTDFLYHKGPYTMKSFGEIKFQIDGVETIAVPKANHTLLQVYRHRVYYGDLQRCRKVRLHMWRLLDKLPTHQIQITCQRKNFDLIKNIKEIKITSESYFDIPFEMKCINKVYVIRLNLHKLYREDTRKSIDLILRIELYDTHDDITMYCNYNHYNVVIVQDEICRAAYST